MWSKLRHLPCNMNDFHADRHRFSFETNGKRGEVHAYSGGVTMYFTIGMMENQRREIEAAVCQKIRDEESKWRLPDEAWEIINNYCKENYR